MSQGYYPEDVYQRLKKLEESQVRQEIVLGRIEQDLEAVNKNLQVLTEIQMEQVRNKEEMKSLYEKSLNAANRAHQRIDRVESHLARAVWLVLTVVITGVIAGKAFIGG